MLAGMQWAMRQVLVARGASSRVMSVEEAPVHGYAVEGRGPGPPVVLVHGLGGSAHGFAGLLFRLRERFRRVLALDLPGHGLSTRESDCLPSVHTLLEALRAYVAQEAGAPALVVGNSLGGALALQLATEHPGLVRALALVSPAGAKLPDASADALLAAFDVRTRKQARELTGRLFHRVPLRVRLVSGGLVQFYGSPTVRALVAEIAATRLALEAKDLAALTVPVLLLWGGSEKLLPPQTLDFFRAHLPRHADVRVVEGFGHVPQVESPAALVTQLVGFADSAGL